MYLGKSFSYGKECIHGVHQRVRPMCPVHRRVCPIGKGVPSASMHVLLQSMSA